MNAQYVFKLPQDQWNRQLAAIARLGIGVVREDALWSWVERQPPSNGRHSYDWTRPDAIVASLAENGLRWYPILDYSTPWAGTLPGPEGWKSAPANPAYFAEYAQAFASRYGSGGSFWTTHPWLPALPVQTYEIWNEPNLPDFWPDINEGATRYGELLSDTAPAIRAADPNGQVTVGGLSPAGLTEFLNEIEARDPGLIGQMDAVAFHPYGGDFAGTGTRVRLLREWLIQHGAGDIPIEITETGWASPPLEEDKRAARMSTLVQGLADSSCGISRIIPYTWLTFESDPQDPEEWFGIANFDGSPKPTGLALASSIEMVMAGSDDPSANPCATLENTRGQGQEYPPVSRPTPTPETTEAILPTGSVEPVLGVANRASSLPSTDEEGGDQPAERQPLQVSVQLDRSWQAITVRVQCAPACRSIVRLHPSDVASVRSRNGASLARRHRATLSLHRTFGAVAVEVTAHSPGRRPIKVVRRLR